MLDAQMERTLNVWNIRADYACFKKEHIRQQSCALIYTQYRHGMQNTHHSIEISWDSDIALSNRAASFSK